MRKMIVATVTLAGVAALALTWNATHNQSAANQLPPTTAKGGKGPVIVHDVYFTLKDNSPAARQKLVAACKKYLTKHPGEVFFAAGVVVKEFDRPVNDRDWDVGLHIVFQDRKAHDLYQDAPRHKQFIDENKDNWKKVRVFDTEGDR